MQRNISLTIEHDRKLNILSSLIGVNKSEILRRAIDLLWERERKRRKEG